MRGSAWLLLGVALLLLAGGALGETPEWAEHYGQGEQTVYFQWHVDDSDSPYSYFLINPLNLEEGDSITVYVDGEQIFSGKKEDMWDIPTERVRKYCGGVHTVKATTPRHHTYEKKILFKCVSRDYMDGWYLQGNHLTLRPVGYEYSTVNVSRTIINKYTLEPASRVKIIEGERFMGVTGSKGEYSYPRECSGNGGHNESFLYVNDDFVFGAMMVGGANCSLLGTSMRYSYVRPHGYWSSALTKDVEKLPEWTKKDITFIAFEKGTPNRVANASIYIDGEPMGKTDGLGVLSVDIPDCGKDELFVQAVKEGYLEVNKTIAKNPSFFAENTTYKYYCLLKDTTAEDRAMPHMWYYDQFTNIITLSSGEYEGNLTELNDTVPPEESCAFPELWCEAKKRCVVSPLECFEEYEVDSPCTEGWPAHQPEGKQVEITGPNDVTIERVSTCDLYEVRDPMMKGLARHAVDCCLDGCQYGCHSSCNENRRISGLEWGVTHPRLKICSARYIIDALGPRERFMRDYYYPELFCGGYMGVDPGFFGSWDCGYYYQGIEGYYFPGLTDSVIGLQRHEYNDNAQAMECVVNTGSSPMGWVSDTDMSKNSCVLSNLPAHVSAFKLHTGTCADYSIVLTTLLRMVGYSEEDVYTVGASKHSWNLVKFPGHTKFTFVDTTGNKRVPMLWNMAPPSVPGVTPYCDLYDKPKCWNDYGISSGSCPPKSEIWGCS